MHINYVGVLNVTNKRECDEFAAKKKETEKMDINRERERIYEVREEMKEESMRKRERERERESKRKKEQKHHIQVRNIVHQQQSMNTSTEIANYTNCFY